ncbi:GNAT family N-acetyltransferase [soil metagenome]
MRIARIGTDDVGLAAVLFADYRVFYGQPYDLDVAETFLRERLTADESIIFLAYNDDEEAVGFIQVYRSFSSTTVSRTWILNDLFVDERARGTGVVDALMSAVEEHAAADGIAEIELATAHDNVRAQTVYVRHGYELDTVFRIYTKPVPPR